MPKTTKKITTIPATLTRFTATPINQQKKRRVAGYARVSTDHDDQFSSYAAQVDYYTNYIKGRDDWEFVEVYTDDGITGTTVNRPAFQRTMQMILCGEVNSLIVTELSQKINTVIQMKAEVGTRIASIPPYGYQKDPEDKYKFPTAYFLFKQGISLSFP